MLYEFKSRASGTITMTEPVGRLILSIIGKNEGRQGIITVAEMPAAISALEKAARESRQAEAADRSAASAAPGGTYAAQQAGEDKDADLPVGIHARIVPFLDMLRASQQGGRDVMWGV